MATGFLDLSQYSEGTDLLGTADFDATIENLEGISGPFSIVDDAGLPQGKLARIEAERERAFVAWLAGPSIGDGQTLCLFRRPGDDNALGGAAMTIDAGNRAYGSGIRNGTGGDITLRTFSENQNGQDTIVNVAALDPADTSGWIWIRYTRDGSNHNVRMWPADLNAPDWGASSEPANAQIDETSDLVSGAHPIGFWVFTNTADPAPILEWAYLSYSTSGDPAPFPQDVGAEITGTVEDEAGTAVENADVYAVRTAGGSLVVLSTTTDSNGGYTFADPDAGTYAVFAVDTNTTDGAGQPYTTQPETVEIT